MSDWRHPMLVPLGDTCVLVRFARKLEETANRRAVAFARRLTSAPPVGVLEIIPNLVSVLVRFDPSKTRFDDISGDLRLAISVQPEVDPEPAHHAIAIRFGGASGPDLEAAAHRLGLSPAKFIAAHNSAPLRVLAIGFAPGFVYCGMHPQNLTIPRRAKVRTRVEAGAVLFAAGQTAITATCIPTGWHVIGHTDFANFDAAAEPPTRLRAGDCVRFEAVVACAS